MRKEIAAVVGVFFIVSLFVPPTAGAQMDMLPQIFRDLPPELQQGLPEQMTHEEYRQLNRNVDFMSMFMSMFVPGYAMFQVERPALGWTIAGVRLAGYGLMGLAIGRQWNDWRDIRNLENISLNKYDRFKENVFLFSSGIFLNGLGWAFDVGGAYHIAKQDRDFVTYRYGLREGLDEGAGDEQRDIEYIRRLVLQNDPDERQVSEELHGALDRYRSTYPRGEHRAEAEYYEGSLFYSAGELPQALLHFTRQFYFFPDERYSPLSRGRALRIVQENRNEWPEDRDLLLSMMSADREPFASQGFGSEESDEDGSDGFAEPGSERYARRVRAFLDGFRNLEGEEFRRMFADEAIAISQREPEASYAADALFAAAEQLEALGDFEEAVVTHTMLAGTYPESGRWRESVLSIGRLLEQELDEPEYAQRFYRRLIERFPDSGEASAARQELESL
ncbi:MAG: tetratricopeptide repeat protein [Spirochaetia bacterium]